MLKAIILHLYTIKIMKITSIKCMRQNLHIHVYALV